MIDTAGKFLGKTPKESNNLNIEIESEEGVANPEKYKIFSTH